MSHLPRQYSACKKTCREYTANRYKAVCRGTQNQAGTNQSNRSRAVHEMGQETGEDRHIDFETMKSVNFNSRGSVITRR